MTWLIIAYAAALYLLRGHKQRSIRQITHTLAVAWIAGLSVWLIAGGNVLPGMSIAIRVMAAVWLIMWIGTPLARRVGFAALPIITAYVLTAMEPEKLGSALINATVFAQLCILAWGAWGDGLRHFLVGGVSNRRGSDDHNRGIPGANRQAEGLDQ